VKTNADVSASAFLNNARQYHEAAEEIVDDEGLTLTETAAMLSSLSLPDQEGLPEIATVSVLMIREAAKFDGSHQKAFENIATDPLWLKYANSAHS
jgi:hypothetical protein